MTIKEISHTDTLISKRQEKDGGYKELINYLDGDITVEVDGKEILVKNQGSYQTAYIITSNDVHHSKQGFPNIRTDSSVNDTASLVFYPYSTEECDMQGRLRMNKSESHFHYHNGRQSRLILAGKIRMEWIQNNKLHSVELEKDDWIAIPANTPYRTVVLDPCDLLSNWVSFPKEMTMNKLNTIGKFRKLESGIKEP